ncbi:MAG: hypothetical protein U9Q03_03710 [Patescibacteria group bacterium]|nr:hypothetical protein [Patescibacteria group bacterium]
MFKSMLIAIVVCLCVGCSSIMSGVPNARAYDKSEVMSSTPIAESVEQAEPCED